MVTTSNFETLPELLAFLTDSTSPSVRQELTLALARLTGSEKNIVLLRRRVHPDWPHSRKTFTAIDDAVAPANPLLGVMLPYTPLHHLLLSEFRFPVVATSGNLFCPHHRDIILRLTV